MPRVVGISFRRVGKVYYFDPGELNPREGDFVIAETSRGLEFGEVMLEAKEIPTEELVAPLKKIVRLASGQDLDREASNRDSEARGFDMCQRKISEHSLPMKLIDAERSFDGTQITFYFSSENRVDFRDLVKDLSQALNLKVQLHQIGVRDEAKLLGGYGTCGRPLCCATFLNNFEPVSMKMAKDQSLFLNPAKFSGICGKLMCCLKYEHEVYKDAKTRLPAVGAFVETPRGPGKVIDVNVISEMLTVQTEEQVTFDIAAGELDLGGCCRKHGCGCPMKDQGCQPLQQTVEKVERVEGSDPAC
jgi:cell fate regulator YaaT (PSP1 superfamily)